jgi:hypothetical protein
MSREWIFSDVEFFAIWDRVNGRYLPEPFSFASKTRFEGEFHRELAEARSRLAPELGRSFQRVLYGLEQPDIRILSQGYRADPENPGTISMLVVRSGDDGFVVHQTPAVDTRYYHSYRITECDVEGMSEAIVGGLPSGVAAGRWPDFQLPAIVTDADGMDYSYGRSAVLKRPQLSTGAQAAQFLQATAIGTGTIDVIQGESKFGPRGITRHRLEWRDLEDDGRYVVTDSQPPSVLAVNDQRFTDLIDGRIIEVIQVLNDERRR